MWNWLKRNPVVGFGLGVLLAAGLAWAVDTKISGLTNGTRALFDDQVPTANAGATTNTKYDVEEFLSANVVGQPRKRSYFYDDLFYETLTTTIPVAEINSGTNADCNFAQVVSSHPGIVTCDTGTTATGRAGIGIRASTPNMIILPGGGGLVFEWEVMLPVLSISTERYDVTVGAGSTGGSPQNDAIAFTYDEGGTTNGCAASANWQRLTSNDAVRTCTASTVAVTANQWYTLRVECNAAATSCEYFVDGTSVGSNTTNIPSGAGDEIAPLAQIRKTVGTTQRDLQTDYLVLEIDFTTARD